MPKQQQKVPKLRFPEFSGEWENKKLGEIGDVLMCKRIFAEETNEMGQIPFFKIGTLGGKPDAFISKALFDKYKSQYNYPRKGEVLITCSGTVGKCLEYDGKDAYYQDSNIVWIDNPKLEIINRFLLRVLSKIDWGKLNSTTITRIYNSDLRSLSIVFPLNKNEQEKIAEFLTVLDRRIEKLQQQEKLLEKYKSGVMQKIFSKKIRFTDENGKNYPAWESGKLEDIAVKKASTISANTLEGKEGKYKIYGASGVLKAVDFYTEEDAYIAIVKDGAGVGRLSLCEAKTSTLGTLDIIKPQDRNNLYFLFYVMQNIDFTKFVTGSTIPHIYFKDYSKIKIGIPHPDEQTKIANFLNTIDGKIETVGKKIAAVQNFKKSLLQQMFV